MKEEKLDNKLISKDISVKKFSHYFKPIIFSIVLLSLVAIVITHLSFKKLNKEKSLKNLQEIETVPYDTPNKLNTLLDYIFYPYHSDIIRDLDDYEFIRDNLGKVSLKMIFNSNFHGDYAKDVHSRTNHHHLLVLIETENGNRFGGYTSDNFTPNTFGLTSTSIELFKADKCAFLFNLDSKKVFNIKPKESNKALDCDDYFTLSFGEGDLVLRNEFLTSGGISNFPGYYGDENTKEDELTNGEKEFMVKSFEVYHVWFYSEFGDEKNKMGRFKTIVK